MQTTLYTDPAIFDDLADEWQALMRRAINAPLFMTADYQKIWWQHLACGELRLITVRDSATQMLVGLAPLLVDDQRVLRFVGCVDVSDYLDFLVDRNYQQPVYRAIVEFLAGPLANDWQTAYFCSLNQQSVTPAELIPLATAQGWQALPVPEDVCPVITLAATWEDYLAGIDKKQRHEIRRKLRKAETEAQTRWYVIDSPALLSDAAIDTFIELHRKSATEKDQFWTEPMLNFFRVLIKRMAELNYLKLYFVEINGTPASTLLCFDYHNELLLYNSGFDAEEFGALSPGNIIVSYSIQHAIELKRTRYDFLRGDEIYKFRFGGIAEPVCAVQLTGKSEP